MKLRYLQLLIFVFVLGTSGVLAQSSRQLSDNKEIVQHFNVYPNPVKDRSWVDIQLERAAKVKIEVLTILGERVLDVTDAYLDRGENKLFINGNQLQKGTYFLRVVVNNKVYKTIRLAKT